MYNTKLALIVPLYILLCHSILNADELLEVAAHGTPEQVQKLIDAGAVINPSKSKIPPLSMAAETNPDPGVVRVLLNAGANIEASIFGTRTPLCSAAASNNSLEVIRTLVESGANQNAKDEFGLGVLHLAARYNTPEIISYLLDKGLSVTKKDSSGLTPLYYALKYNNKKAVDIILEAANSNSSATRKNPYIEIYNQILKGTFNIDNLRAAKVKFNSTKDGCSILHFAARYASDDKLIEMLVDSKAKINVKDDDGGTPLLWATRHNPNPQVIATIIKANADIEKGDDFSTPISNAVCFNNAAVVKLLIDAGVKLTPDNVEYNPTFLFRAARLNKDPEVIKVLINAGLDINATNNNGETALHTAAAWSTPSVINALIAGGADIFVQDNHGGTPVMNAVSNNNDPKVIKAFLDAGYDVNKKEAFGLTLLHIASRNKNPDIVSLLLDSGAQINVKDQRGNTPLFYSDMNTNKEIKNRLLQAGAK